MLGGENGLTLSDTIFGVDLEHPTALALADLGEGQDLKLLVCEEGDELVRVFDRDALMPESGTSTATLTALATALSSTTQSVLSDLGGSVTNFGAAVAGLSVLALQDTVSEVSALTGSDPRLELTALLKRADFAITVGKQWIESTLELIDSTLAKKLADPAVIEAARRIVDVLLPATPLQAIDHLVDAMLNSRGRNALDPNAVDQALEANDAATDDTAEQPRPDQLPDRGVRQTVLKPAGDLRLAAFAEFGAKGGGKLVAVNPSSEAAPMTGGAGSDWNDITRIAGYGTAAALTAGGVGYSAYVLARRRYLKPGI